MIDQKWVEILKSQLRWLDGFAAAIDNRHLATWVANMGENVNRIIRGEMPGPPTREKANQDDS